MCGIVGFIGREQAAPILLDGLARLEYRGYDSTGVAVYSEKNHALTVRKDSPLMLGRSEERRVGKEGRSRWSPYH